MTSLRRVAAWLVLASLVMMQSGGLLEARHAALNDDAACLGVVVTSAHHAGGAQFETVLPSPALEHCAFCHLQRAFSNARPGSLSATFLPPLSAAAIAEPAIALASGIRPGFTPRGPPVSL